MSVVADGVKQRTLTLVAGGRNIEIYTARIAPTVRDMNTDVFADFGLGDVIDNNHVIGTQIRSDDEYYTGIIPFDLQADKYPARLSDLSDAILKDAGRRGYSSLWLNFSDKPSWREISSTFEDYLGFLDGIKQYAVSVGEEQPTSHVSEIVIGCGVQTYRVIDNSFRDHSSVMRILAVFPAGMLRVFR